MSITQAEHNVSKNQPIPSRTRTGDALLFARNFFRHPRMLGSIIPSSRFLIKELLQPIDWNQARVIVEYGPGVGVITEEILRRMRSLQNGSRCIPTSCPTARKSIRGC